MSLRKLAAVALLAAGCNGDHVGGVGISIGRLGARDTGRLLRRTLFGYASMCKG